MFYGLAVAVGFGFIVLWVLAMVAAGIENMRNSWECAKNDAAYSAKHETKLTWTEWLSVAFFAVALIVVTANVFGLLPSH